MKKILLLLSLNLLSCSLPAPSVINDIVSSGTEVQLIAGGYKFTEGPANDAAGNIYFTDIPNNHIIKWSVKDQKAEVFIENSAGANGLWVNDEGKILACLGEARQIALIDPATKNSEVLASLYNGKPFNKPNDLWRDAKGGIYFSDPNYRKGGVLSQDGEHVYYRKPNGMLIRVIDDYERPNGLIGTKDGKILYVTDRNAKKTYSYKIKDDGTLTDKKLFAEVGSDGMTLDEFGNLYLTSEVIEIFRPDGLKIGEIKVPETPANICFGGADGKTLFITARTGFYAVHTQVKGMYTK